MCSFLTYSTFIACHIMRSILQFTWMSFSLLYFFFCLAWYWRRELSALNMPFARLLLFHGMEKSYTCFAIYGVWNIFGKTSSQWLMCLSIQSFGSRNVLMNFRNWCTAHKLTHTRTQAHRQKKQKNPKDKWIKQNRKLKNKTKFTTSVKRMNEILLNLDAIETINCA